ncbi:MAG TPA: hypothetical protein DIT13_07700 [Verrucomicrobiales bacterium]|nr:hypothetical protein [Verrucomicrobiales bacterium]
MSDSNSQENRRRRNRGPRGPRSGPPRPGKTPRAGAVQPTGFQKFLSAISFGLLGQPKALPRAASPSKPTTGRGSASPSQSGGSPRPPRPKREAQTVKPEEVNTERLYIGNLSYDATESDLFELFSGVGSVRNSEVVVNNRTQRSKGFAFVTMGSVEEARRAVQELGGKEFMGRPLQLSGAKPIGYGDDRGDRGDRDESSEAA